MDIVKAKSSLKSLMKLKDNWDSYNSPPVLIELINNANEALESLEKIDVPVPYVAPISGGGLQLEWHFNNKGLEVEFVEKDIIGFLKVFEDESMEEGEINIKEINKIKELFDWLTEKGNI